MKPRTAILRRTRLSPISKRRQKESAEYRVKRAAFLAAHPYCQGTIKLLGLDEKAVIEWQGMYRGADGVLSRIPASWDIHHIRKRGRYYLDETTWMAICRQLHRRIHDHKTWARSMGLLV